MSADPRPAHDQATVRRWLGILHGDSPGHIHVCSTDDWSGRTFPAGSLDDAAAYVGHLDGQGREGIYVRISSLRTNRCPEYHQSRAERNACTRGWHGRGEAADSAALPALWADLDLAGPGHAEQDLPPDEAAGRQIIATSGLPEPTLWIHSGGGLYPIWLLDKPLQLDDTNLDQAKRLAANWQKIIEHAAASHGWRYGRGVGDLARVLRIPGTINRKEGLARPCRIISASPTRYTVDQLTAALDAAMARIAPPPPAQPTGVPLSTVTRPAGAVSPGDDYAARNSWADILEPAGWRELYRHDDVTYWTRPGKPTGISASTNALGTDRLHVFTTAASPLEGGESYSKLGAYAALHHAGDHSAAARALAAAGYGTPLPDPGQTQREAFTEILGSTPPDRPPITEPIKRTWDDIGNADRLTDRYSDRIRFTIDADRWGVYTGTHWAFDGANTLILGLVRDMLDDLPATEAYEYDDTPRVDENSKKKPSVREEFLTFVNRQRVHRKMLAAIAIACTTKSVQGRAVDFDADPYLFNCANGVVDLRTGDLMPHDSQLMLSAVAGPAYDPSADAPQWQRFLEQVMPDPDCRAYLARVVGYTLTGATNEQVLFLHHGTGANGKSVFMQVIQAMLGSYGQTVPQGALLAKQGQQGGIPNDIARMIGKRLLITSETGAGRRLDDEMVKQLTGGEQVSARFMRGEFFDFTPIGKIHILTNHLPNVSGGDGIARRLHDIGWDVTIPPERRDKHLAARIIADELPGVLTWAVRGSIEWQQRGLMMPEAVRRKTADHLHQADPIAQWAEERVEVSDYEIETHELYVDYREWTESRGSRAMTEKAFVQVLDERGWQRGKHPTSRRSVVYGVRILPRLVASGGFRVA